MCCGRCSCCKGTQEVDNDGTVGYPILGNLADNSMMLDGDDDG